MVTHTRTLAKVHSAFTFWWWAMKRQEKLRRFSKAVLAELTAKCAFNKKYRKRVWNLKREKKKKNVKKYAALKWSQINNKFVSLKSHFKFLSECFLRSAAGNLNSFMIKANQLDKTELSCFWLGTRPVSASWSEICLCTQHIETMWAFNRLLADITFWQLPNKLFLWKFSAVRCWFFKFIFYIISFSCLLSFYR